VLECEQDALNLMRNLDLSNLERVFQTIELNGLSQQAARLKPFFPDFKGLCL
jgi:hypothetical protein